MNTYYVVEDRPDPPAFDGRCEVAGCEMPQAVHAWSREFQVWFRYFEDCASEKVDEYPDLTVVDDE